MAKKSKTQRAKASAKRAEKKVTEAQPETVVEAEVEQTSKKAKLGKTTETTAAAPAKKAEAKSEKKADKPAKKIGFLSEVRSELKRVTWPSRQDVLRWSGVVVVALLFFSAFVFVLDNWVVTPILYLISSIGV